MSSSMNSSDQQEDFTVLKRRIKANVVKQVQVFPHMHSGFASGLGPLELRSREKGAGKYTTIEFNFALLHHINSKENLQAVLTTALNSANVQKHGELRKQHRKTLQNAWDFYLIRRNSMNMSPKTFINLDNLRSLKGGTLAADEKTTANWILSAANPLINYEHLGLSPDDDQLYRLRFRSLAAKSPPVEEEAEKEHVVKAEHSNVAKAEPQYKQDDSLQDDVSMDEKEVHQIVEDDEISVTSSESGIFFDMPHELKRKYGIPIHADSDSDFHADLRVIRSEYDSPANETKVENGIPTEDIEMTTKSDESMHEASPEPKTTTDGTNEAKGLSPELKGPLRTMWRLLALHNFNGGKIPGLTLLTHFQFLFDISDDDECKLWKEFRDMEDPEQEIINEAYTIKPVRFGFELSD